MVRKLTTQGELGVNLDPQRFNFLCEYIKDFNARRAATASGFHADQGYRILEETDVAKALTHCLTRKLNVSMIDAEWLLMELVDNHFLARQADNISASNVALGTIAKHRIVDAFAADKVITSSDKEVMDQLLRGRKRIHQQLDDDGLSFL